MALAYADTASRLQFSASSDGLLLWLSEDCWGRGLVRLGELLVGAAFSEGVELLIERQAEQPEPPLDLELEALLPF
ncbi:MAG: hypothetical protein K0U63_01785 [Cyanobacteria bacterium]|nr:hypothetical protein [Cyanobacteriota bacterium]